MHRAVQNTRTNSAWWGISLALLHTKERQHFLPVGILYTLSTNKPVLSGAMYTGVVGQNHLLFSWFYTFCTALIKKTTK